MKTLDKVLWISLLSIISSVDVVFGSIFCKDSKIDAITYVRDTHRWFIVSEGHYWLILRSNFPPTDSDSKPLPEPFKRPTAAVYIDSQKGCPKPRVNGITIHEKQIWITELIGGRAMIIAYDTITLKWTPTGGTPLNTGRCLRQSNVEFSAPIDAMFVRKYWNIYLVQGKRYGMVDCKLLCNGDDTFGEGKPLHNITDFDHREKIDAMLIDSNDILYLFEDNHYFQLNIKSEKNGRLTAKKSGPMIDISVLFNINKSEECDQKTTETIDEPNGDPSADPNAEPIGEQTAEPSDQSTDTALTSDIRETKPVDSTDTTTESLELKEKGSESHGFLYVVIGVVLIVVVLCLGLAAFVFYSVKLKKKPKLNSGPPQPLSSTETVRSLKINSKK